MARILCVTNGLPGILYASLELSRRLRSDGHEVIYGSSPATREAVAGQGFEFLEIEPSAHEAFLEVDARAPFLWRLSNVRDRRRRGLEAHGLERFRRAVSRLAPDLLLIDAEMHEHVIAASDLGLTMALLNTFVSIWRQPGLPPPHHFARPGVGWKGSRWGTRLLWLDLDLWKVRRAWSLRLRHVGCDRLALLDLLAERHEFDMRRETDKRQWPIPFTYSRLPILSLHALEFEFPHQPRREVHYLGPMVSTSRPDGRVTKEAQATLEAVFERRRAEPERRRLIYAGFGSFTSVREEVVRRLFDAVARREDWDLVIALGARAASYPPDQLPANVHVLGWVPQLSVLQNADVAVIHGGINTVDECIAFAVPTLVFCGGETDMAGTTARAVHHGVAIAADPKRDDAAAIGTHLERLLTETGFRDSVIRMRSATSRYTTDRVAEQVVTSLLAGAPGGRA